MKRIATLCTLICLATVTITLAQPPEGKKGRPKRSFNSPKQQAQATQATDSSSDSEAAATFAASVGEQQATSPTAMSAMAAMAGQQSSSPSKTDRNNFIVNLTKGIDIGQILSPLSEMTKKAVLKDPAVQGKVQIFAAGKVAPDEALQLIYDALQLQDIAVYETTRSIQLIPASKAATMPIPVLQAHESASSFTHRSQIVQKIFKMKTIPPRNVQMALQPLVTKQGSISTDDRTGTLFVTDTVGNVQRFETVVATLDREEASQYVMKTIRLQHGQPDEIADLVMTMLSASGGISTPFGPRPSFFGSDSSSYRRRFGLGSARTLGDVTIIPDSRTASLMVIGPREKVERIEKMVAELDFQARMPILQADESASSITNKSQIVQKIFKLKTATATTFQSRLQPLLGREGAIVADDRTRTVIVTDAAGNIERVEQLLAILDSEVTADFVIDIVRLENARAEDITDVVVTMMSVSDGVAPTYGLRSGFPSGFGSESRRYRSMSPRSVGDVTIIPDLRMNWLIVAGPREKVDRVKQIIASVDVQEHITILQADQSASSITNKSQIVQKIFKIKTATASTFQSKLQPLLGREGTIISDDRTKTVIITDTAGNIERLEHLIATLDRDETDEYVIDIIRLQNARAEDITDVVVTMISVSEGLSPSYGSRSSYYSGSGFGGDDSFRRRFRSAATRTVGDVMIMPDSRTNWLIVVGPREKVERVKKIVAGLDIQEHIPILQADQSASSITNKSQIVQKIFNLKSATAKIVQSNLQPLLGREGIIISDDRTKTVIITDTVGNIERFEQLIATMDRDETEGYVVDVVRLQNARAEEITDVVVTMISVGEGLSTPYGSRSSYYPGGYGGYGGGGEESFRRRFRSATARTVGDIMIMPDLRMNWLIIAGPREKVERVKKIIADLDIQDRVPILQADESASSITNKSQVVQKIFNLKSASARTIQSNLQALLGRDGTIIADDRTKTIIITDAASNIERFEQVITTLDRDQAERLVVRVVRLRNAQAEDIVDVVVTMMSVSAGLSVPYSGRSSYSGGYGGDGSSYSDSYRRRFSSSSTARTIDDVMIIPDSRMNWLVVAGPGEKVDRVEKMVGDLDIQGHIPILQYDESASSVTNKAQVVQKVFKLKLTTVKSVQAALVPLIGRQGSISGDERTRTIVITDTAGNVERYEQLIAAIDRLEAGQIEVKVFKLEYADAADLVELVATMATAGEEGITPSYRGSYGGGSSYYGSGYSSSGRRGYGGYGSGRGYGSVGGTTVGDVVIIPDQRTNWLIVAGPPDRLAQIEKLVKEVDVEGRTDVAINIIDVKHADAFDLAMDVGSMITEKIRRERQELFQIRSNQRGNQLIVMSTPQTYKMVEQLIQDLDTTFAVHRETRTYELKYMDATDMADALNQLYQEETRGMRYLFGYMSGGGGRRGYGQTEVNFVPQTRTNSLMVIASPTEFEFIERMIKELDVEVPEENIAPRVYHVVHTDAAEMATVLTNLFEGSAGRRTGASLEYTIWRPRTTSSQQGVGALYGKVRFVVYRNTNSIVAITNNPQNFSIIESLIKELDVLDPEATNMLVIQLQYADALQVANYINNLLSEGPVARPGGSQQQQQRTTTQQPQRTTGGSSGEGSQQPTTQLVVDAIYPWQSSSRQPGRAGEEERPISTLIGQVRIVPDSRSQKLIVAAPSIYFESLKQLIEEIDKPEPQVELRTHIIRLDVEGQKRLGWRWMPPGGTVTAEELDNAFQAAATMGITETWNEMSKAATLVTDGRAVQPGGGIFSADIDIVLLLQLLIKNRNATVIAQPQVTVNNNERGSIFVGEQVPFETGSVTSTEGRSAQTTVDYRDVGTRLEITPQINKQGRVVLQVIIENSRRKPEALNGRVITETQNYETKLTIEPGQKVWLGGLSEQRLDNIVRKFPLLGDIPYIGYLFQKMDKVTLDSRIYAIIEPTVIENPQQAEARVQTAAMEIKTLMTEQGKSGVKLPRVVEELTSPSAAQSARRAPLKYEEL